jgi:hypothetical protein
MTAMFEQELAAYTAKLPEWEREAGKFAVIKGDRIEGVFDTYFDALKVGYDRFKLEPFLVKQISPVDLVLHFTRDLAPACQ